MSQIPAVYGEGESRELMHAKPHEPPHVAARRLVDSAQATAPKILGTIAAGLMLLGVLCVVVLIVLASPAGAQHTLAAYHAGVMYALGIGLGGLGYVMIFQQTNAGWMATLRRLFENVASSIPFVFLLFAPVLIAELFVYHGAIFKWMRPALFDPASPTFDHLLEGKRPFLNDARWVIFAFVYFGIWTFLGTSLYRLSRKQDATGDKWLTAKARRRSSYGLLLFALTTAFASFDWLMSLDYHFFSTMWGVYYFAGSILSTTAVVIILVCVLKLSGKLGPPADDPHGHELVSSDHLHDLSKLLFAFTVFWAYITFSQYFLIWYSNVPEETAYFLRRKSYGWGDVGFLLALGQFGVPFLVLLFRPVKRNFKVMLFVALWVLLFRAVDMFYIVRPQVLIEAGEGGALPHAAPPLEWLPVDIVGILGPVLLFVGFIFWRTAGGPLVPLKDPRLHEALEHKNYI